MASENIEAARAFVDAVNRGDVDAVVRLCDPEVTFEPLRSATEGAFVGHDGIRRFLEDTSVTFDVFQVEIEELRDLGNEVLGIGSIRIRGRAGGVETDIPTAAIAHFTDGRLSRYKDFGEREAALEAAGLSE
jgi:ketosteroid isomerase-like protein